jgi:hypothetical protein
MDEHMEIVHYSPKEAVLREVFVSLMRGRKWLQTKEETATMVVAFLKRLVLMKHGSGASAVEAALLARIIVALCRGVGPHGLWLHMH